MSSTQAQVSFFSQRRAGVLLHPTSLPCSESRYLEGTTAFGTLGKEAYRFIDFMAEAGLSVWQMLPTGPTHQDLSPYQSISAHAGNPDLISFDWLIEQGWIPAESVHLFSPDRTNLAIARQQAGASFFAFIQTEYGASVAQTYHAFCAAQAYWLDDVSLFCALRNHFQQQSWTTWPEGLRQHDQQALSAARQELAPEVAQVCFEQFAFFQQWQSLRNYAQKKSIYLFGDIPIFVAHDSADVWAEQGSFLLDEAGQPMSVAGVPPDYFSETGQHWGNPHYDWDVMRADNFRWWLARLKTQLELFDLIRIDHFRGFEAYWSIPGDTQDARQGEWIKAPGEALLNACFAAYPDLPLVAENLGVITDEVEALRKQFALPGMLVLQFAFDGNPANPHLPHNHSLADVIYSGTHDNDTSLGWYASLNDFSRQQLRSYCFHSSDAMPWLLINLALSSVGRMAIIPMQDFMELDGRHRMNMPGTTDKNWVWTFDWDQVDPGLATRIRQQLATYHRLVNQV
ncbi:4-alpha-glucanotransferase [Cellvibrio japonicus]|uniref:4-alpha-glucanotransferase n=1 Tax=Cellvibrio japonicus (strain Ueda107) TaxID=498211 RepID=B3PGN1_CELJU|nr:4-alpha-glucanotransferase [Cellvibrio japonicus]ACE84553.1 4-alpha-glucanotransferase, putative, mal77 [Cellvibrio japonicus Ueda107]QEI12377.1 4-alpha-glucanotransferase [Cellvibrio japonicus]QEI15950.1 4-alpha-glucanotransferase [Cellvibrio japonicus]QEI19529.1 4-alpha-glucanotransferase [Cellvibrio japonicus]